MLLRNARLVPLGRPAPPDPVDVRLAGARVAEIGPSLAPDRGEEVLAAEGRWLIPGLWDAHVHLGQWARRSTRLDLAGCTSRAEALARVAAGLDSAEAVLVGAGYRPAAWADPPTVAALDAVTGSSPVVLVSGDAHAGWLNSAALARFGLPAREHPITEAEWFEVVFRVAAAEDAEVGPGAYADALLTAAALGVVGVIDYEFEAGFAAWPGRYPAVGVPLRVRTSVYPRDLDAAVAAGVRTGDALVTEAGEPLVTMGSLKIISDGSLNTRTAHCCEPYAGGGHGVQNVPLPELCDLLDRARRHGLEVALHAIGDAAVATAIEAFGRTGATGSIEHAQLLRPGDPAAMAQLNLVASVQPAHLLDDRAVTGMIWDDERAARSFPLRNLEEAGVRLALGSDAPVAPLDPWLAMAAAVHRGEPGDPPWHPGQSLTAVEALAASTGGRSTVTAGDPADRALLDADPLAAGDSAEVAGALRAMRTAATLVAGRVVHDAR